MNKLGDTPHSTSIPHPPKQQPEAELYTGDILSQAAPDTVSKIMFTFKSKSYLLLKVNAFVLKLKDEPAM